MWAFLLLMPTFVPPKDKPSHVEWQDETIGHTGLHSLWRWYREPIGARSVRIVGGVVEPLATEGAKDFVDPDDILSSDIGSGDAGKAFFRGGHSYEVTPAETVLLTTAGYLVPP